MDVLCLMLFKGITFRVTIRKLQLQVFTFTKQMKLLLRFRNQMLKVPPTYHSQYKKLVLLQIAELGCSLSLQQLQNLVAATQEQKKVELEWSVKLHYNSKHIAEPCNTLGTIS
ncbi:conserved hypothetical protein [Ricinus communis]|uniref:Uncharacterized protein n=1 Tax=Ricinus communis TaxID=3988 RepID=B9SFY6_RICCO|nr:conserved hypothetical protein [Ricinus communis]